MEPNVSPVVAGPSCEVHLISVCGPVREENEDAGAAWWGEGNEVAVIVSDGMGGHAAGREAAEVVVRSCLEAIRNRATEEWRRVFLQALGSAQAEVLETARRHAAGAMGATAVLAVVDGLPAAPCLHVAHVGDSRAYLHRGRSIYRLTVDHSLVAQMVRDGLLQEEEAFGHPDSNVIQRAIGQEKPLEPEIQAPVQLDPGDVVLICSDGLHGALPDTGIAEIVARAESAEEVCQRLLSAALAAGSQDNVTIGCVRLGVEGAPRRPTRVSSLDQTGGRQ